MKRLSDLTKYVLSVKYIEGEAVPDMEETDDENDNDFAYLEYSEVEELVSELDDAFENCKMNLESAKATIEELQEKLAKADKLIKMFSEHTGYDVDINEYELIY